MEKWVQAFLLHLENKNFSPNTVKSYRADLREFTDYTKKRKVDDLKFFTSAVIRSFLASLPKEDARNTVLRKIAALRSFAAYLMRQGELARNPFKLLPAPKRQKLLPKFLTQEEVERLLGTAANSHLAARDKALFELMYSSGLRRSEITGLKIKDVDFFNGLVKVFGKGSKERPVYFDARTKIHLKNYLDSRTDENPALFVSLMRPFNRLEISGVEIRLRELGRRLGISKVHPHKFRRTLATRAIDKGMPIEQVQRLLGHSKIDTTMQYAMVNQNNVKISHRKYIG